MKTNTDPAVPGHAAGRRTAGPAVAGLVCVAAWVVGLVIGPASLDVTAPGTAVVSAYAGQQGAAIAQVLLTKGVAAVALAVVVLTLGQAARGRRSRRIARRIEVAGLAAVVLSLVQCVHVVRLAWWVAPGGDSSRAAGLFQLISRIDGVKMLLLSILAGSGMTGPPGRGAAPAARLPPRSADSRTGRRGASLPSAEPGASLAGICITAAHADLGGRHGPWLSRGPEVSQACQRPANRDPVTTACRSFRGSRAQSRIPGRSGH